MANNTRFLLHRSDGQWYCGPLTGETFNIPAHWEPEITAITAKFRQRYRAFTRATQFKDRFGMEVTVEERSAEELPKLPHTLRPPPSGKRRIRNMSQRPQGRPRKD